mmetsp:Transcript_3381/g.7287  ORF Transcript_3381/g.7287 Transcript_3381/m.7287 type:complete len:227 (+) Transcript_3381:1171-1851(+)
MLCVVGASLCRQVISLIIILNVHRSHDHHHLRKSHSFVSCFNQRAYVLRSKHEARKAPVPPRFFFFMKRRLLFAFCLFPVRRLSEDLVLSTRSLPLKQFLIPLPQIIHDRHRQALLIFPPHHTIILIIATIPPHGSSHPFFLSTPKLSNTTNTTHAFRRSNNHRKRHNWQQKPARGRSGASVVSVEDQRGEVDVQKLHHHVEQHRTERSKNRRAFVQSEQHDERTA